MSDNEVGEGSVSFSITCSDDPENPRRFTLGPKDEAIKVGRNKKNALALSNTGVSWVHCEIKRIGGEGRPGLGVRDLSANGVGLKAPYHDLPIRVEKGVDVEVEHGSVLILPFKVSRKEKHSETPQTTLTVEIDGEEVKQSGPVLVTYLAASPVGGGLGAPMLGGPKPSGLQSTVQDDAVYIDDDEEDLRSRSRSPRRGKQENGGADDLDGEKTDGKDEAAPAEEGNAKKKGKRKLAPGALVRVTGLSARGELNGKVGTVIDFDQAGGFWKVRMEDGSGKAFKTKNLVLDNKERLARCRALLQEPGDDEQGSDLSQLCREMMDTGMPPPPPDEGEAPPPPPPSDVVFGPEDLPAPPPPPDVAMPSLPPMLPLPGVQRGATGPLMPPGPLAPPGLLAPPAGMDMSMVMGMQGMMGMGMPSMPMMPPMGMPMGFPGMAMGFPGMGMAMPMPMQMGMAMQGMQPPPPTHPPPPL